MLGHKHAGNKGFSLLELVIVIVILAIIAAIAIPRMSRGSAGAADSALSSNLAVLRNAIDLFAAEHTGTFPAVGTIVAQLTQYSDAGSGTSATQTGAYIYGPYVRKIPRLPVGAKAGGTGIAAIDGAGVGWIYDQTTGEIIANCLDSEKDVTGTQYNQY